MLRGYDTSALHWKDEILRIRHLEARIADMQKEIERQKQKAVAAEEFGVPVETVRVVPADTSVTPFDSGQIGSSTTFKAGHAVMLACRDAKRQLFQRASTLLDASPEELDTARGEIFVKESPERSIKVGELFKRTPYPAVDSGAFLEVGSEILGRATYNPKNETLPNGEPMPSFAYSYNAQGVEVEVDMETGKVELLSIVSILDAGKAINPTQVRGQMEGGLSFGTGLGLLEELIVDDGRVTNDNFTDYRIPMTLDLPPPSKVTLELLETEFGEGPYGAKGIGEIVLTPTAPAIGNAIYDAIGVRITDLPITPEKIVRELSSARTS